MNKEICGINLHIQCEYRKRRARKNSLFGHFSRSDEDIDAILKDLNNYNKNIKFKVDRFINEDVIFLDIKFHQNNTDI